MKSMRIRAFSMICMSSCILNFAALMLLYIAFRPTPYNMPYPYTIISIATGDETQKISWEELSRCFGSDEPIVFFESFESFILVHDPSLIYSSTRMASGRYFTNDEFNSGEPVLLASKDPFVDSFAVDGNITVSGKRMRIIGRFECDYGIVDNNEHVLYVAPLACSDSLLSDWNGSLYFSHAAPGTVERLEALITSRGYIVTRSISFPSKSAENFTDRYPPLVAFVLASAAVMSVSLVFVCAFMGWFSRREMRLASRCGGVAATYCARVLFSHAPGIVFGSAAGCLTACIAWNSIFGAQYIVHIMSALASFIICAAVHALALCLGTALAWRGREGVRF